MRRCSSDRPVDVLACFSPEQVIINQDNARIKDNKGKQSTDQLHFPSGAAYFTILGHGTEQMSGGQHRSVTPFCLSGRTIAWGIQVAWG